MSTDLATWLIEQLDADERREHDKRKMPSISGRLCPECGEPISSWEASGWPEWPLYEFQCGDTLNEIEIREFAPPVPAPDPRVLADIAAKRRIISRLGWSYDWPISSAMNDLEEDVLRLLALPYTDREGYDPNWAAGEES